MLDRSGKSLLCHLLAVLFLAGHAYVFLKFGFLICAVWDNNIYPPGLLRSEVTWECLTYLL